MLDCVRQERDSNAAYALAHRYNQILRRMPPPAPVLPPTPPPPASTDHGDGHHSPLHEDFVTLADSFDSVCAEDAAQELEDSVLGLSPQQFMAVDVSFNNSRKRAADNIMSEATSDADTPVALQKKGKEPANKKRKVADSNGIEVVQAIRTSTSKGKGKVKQIREQSPDSVTNSTGTKPRKRPGARKKQDALPPQTQELLGIGSSASVGGDMTPSPSRPASPALTTTSDRMRTTLFELDEEIPPLRKAKKVDDATMLKRVRALAEAQKKVWTTIARRDIPRASSQFGLSRVLLMQLPCRCINAMLLGINQDWVN